MMNMRNESGWIVGLWKQKQKQKPSCPRDPCDGSGVYDVGCSDPGHTSHDGHLVAGQGPGLVGADGGGAAHGLTRRRHRAPLRIPSDAPRPSSLSAIFMQPPPLPLSCAIPSDATILSLVRLSAEFSCCPSLYKLVLSLT